MAFGCSGWEPAEPFHREAPEVNEAIELLDGGQLESAEQVLEAYLGTGPCGDAGIGLPDRVREKHNGSFDLGLVLFYLAERYGQRFGDEELEDAGPEAHELAAQRGQEIDCAQIIVQAIASDPKVPLELRARAYYLAGNLDFLRRRYEDAIGHYDKCLQLVPGIAADAEGDGIGRDAAWNRAIALRRIHDQDAEPPDAEPDAEPDASEDAGEDADEPEAGPDGGEDGGEDAGEDGGDGDGGEQGGADAGAEDGGDGGAEDAAAPEPPPEKEQPAEPEPRSTAMERILDELEEAPTYQEQEAKQRVGVRRRYVMEDK